MSVLDHGFEDDEKFSHAGGEGDLGGLAGVDEALVEGLEDGVMAYSGEGRHVEHFADASTSADGAPFAALASTVPVHGRHTSEAGVRGHVQTGVLAYLLTCILQDRLGNAHLDLGVNDARDQLTRIQCVPLQAGDQTLVKTTRPNEQQRATLHAIGAPIPPQHQAA